MKRKQKRKHLEDAYIPQSANKTKKTLSLQEYALQPRHDRVVPTQDQEAKDSSPSEYFPGVSSVDKLAGAGISNFNQYNPQFGYSLENNYMVREARDRSSESEYFSCYSSFSNFYNVSNTEILKKEKETPQPALIPQQEENKLSILQYLYSLFFANKNTQVLDSVEDDEQPGPSGLPQRTLPRAKDSDSDDVTSVSSLGVLNLHKYNPECEYSFEDDNMVWRKDTDPLNRNTSHATPVSQTFTISLTLDSGTLKRMLLSLGHVRWSHC
nr:uncharacterized protein LOC123275707 isoform X1 [Equus asinus]